MWFFYFLSFLFSVVMVMEPKIVNKNYHAANNQRVLILLTINNEFVLGF